VPFIAGAVVAAVLFVGLAIVLVDAIGLEGAPLAMILAFLPPSLYIFYRSQRGQSPIRLPWRSILLSVAFAVAIGLAHTYIDVTSSVVVEIVLGLGAVALWAFLVVFLGGIPEYHRTALIEMSKGLFGKGGGFIFDPALGLKVLDNKHRRALRRAIKGRKEAHEATQGLLDVPEGEEARSLVAALRRVAVAGGTPGLPDEYASAADAQRDQAIGEFLFAPGPIAGRDQLGKRLLNDGNAEAFDLHTLEATINALRHTERTVWKRPGAAIAKAEKQDRKKPSSRTPAG
jgi:hypothetical protein